MKQENGSVYAIRLATEADLPTLRTIMAAAINQLMDKFLTPEQVAASNEFMGLDTQLIADRTYFACVEDVIIRGCGGWCRRATLFGGDHTTGRNADLLDPQSDAARVRAMYTSPTATRRGVGRRILEACEDAARSEGFRRAELAATLAGEPLYRACGYEPVRCFTATASNGVEVPLILMDKNLLSAPVNAGPANAGSGE